ncbi:MAG: hypothetical protein R3C44_12845 [Chloroflexota bacterium]
MDGRWIGEITLTVDGATPPGGYHWRVPFTPSAVQSNNDATLDGTTLMMSGPGEVTLTFE